MASNTYYKFVGTTDRHTNWTAEVIIKDDDGNKLSVRAGVPVALSATERAQVEGLGFRLEKSTKAEADAVAVTGVPLVGADITGTGPLFGAAVEAEEPTGSKK